MQRAKPYLKTAALASSVLLVGVFIGYRAGAFQQSLSTPAPAPAPQTAETPTVTPPPTAPPSPMLQTIPVTNPAIMYSSKSAPAIDTATFERLVGQPTTAQPTPPTPPSPPNR